MFLPVMSLGRASKLGSSLYKLPVFFFFSVVKQFESNRNIRNKLSDEVEWTWTSFFPFLNFFLLLFLVLLLSSFFIVVAGTEPASGWINYDRHWQKRPGRSL